MRGSRQYRPLWKPLLVALMWSGLIGVHHICVEETVELLPMQDQEVIKAFSPHAAQKALVIWHLLVEPDTAFEAL
jgi:hypothetical protein